jgi:hypothetical protein
VGEAKAGAPQPNDGYDMLVRLYDLPASMSRLRALSGNGGIGTALLLLTLDAMAAEGYAYAIIGAAGPADFYARAVGAVPIAGSTPVIYPNLLRGGRGPG